MSLLEYVYLVSINDLPDVMRNDDDSSSCLDGIDARLDLLCRHGIKTGGRFVQEDDGRVLDEHACYGNTLLLSAAQL